MLPDAERELRRFRSRCRSRKRVAQCDYGSPIGASLLMTGPNMIGVKGSAGVRLLGVFHRPNRGRPSVALYFYHLSPQVHGRRDAPTSIDWRDVDTSAC